MNGWNVRGTVEEAFYLILHLVSRVKKAVRRLEFSVVNDAQDLRGDYIRLLTGCFQLMSGPHGSLFSSSQPRNQSLGTIP